MENEEGRGNPSGLREQSGTKRAARDYASKTSILQSTSAAYPPSVLQSTEPGFPGGVEETEAPKRNRPRKSLRLSFAYSLAAIDVGLWESRESKNGKLMPSSISLRLQDANPQVTRNAVYFKAADALKIANVLQNFAFIAMEEDSAKRIEFARERKQTGE